MKSLALNARKSGLNNHFIGNKIKRSTTTDVTIAYSEYLMIEEQKKQIALSVESGLLNGFGNSTDHETANRLKELNTLENSVASKF